MQLTFYGATREVTGSCYWLQVGRQRLLIECGLIQGTPHHERHNREPFPFSPSTLDAVVLTHAHLDHSGRLPLLLDQGFQGPIYTHRATADLCRILWEDAGNLNEQEAMWENRKRERKGLPPVTPLYTRATARLTQAQFRSLEYGRPEAILPGVTLTLRDAGHILGSAIVELALRKEDGTLIRLIFSGDLGHRGAPILHDPEPVEQADLVVLESTYGDRCHRPWDSTWQELGDILTQARHSLGNILIPAFSIGRTQELLYVFKRYFQAWGLEHWLIFLDSPMAIEATAVYRRHRRLYDVPARALWAQEGDLFDLPNLRVCRDTDDSRRINQFRSGAIIIAGSGMCTGGRIKQHLKHHVWREHTHVIITGFQAQGTLGRALVDGARYIRLWGEVIQVKAQIHTIGGLSAHADQDGLVDWYGQIAGGHPPVALVHGEPAAMAALAERLQRDCQSLVIQPTFGECLDLASPISPRSGRET